MDDSLTTRTLLKRILEAAGFAVLTAPDGASAWAILNNQKQVDLLVSDVQMPRMSGLELTAAIRNSIQWRELPVVLVTALETEAEKEQGMQAGADAYLRKSTFDQQELLAAISRLLEEEAWDDPNSGRG